MILLLSVLLIFNVIIEFLPISSTAHLVLINKILNIDYNINVILAVSQIGITLAVCFYFRNFIKEIIVNLFKLNKKYFLFCLKIFITMLPTVLVGLVFYELIKTYCQNNISIGVCLVLGSLLMLLAEKFYSGKKNSDLLDISFKEAGKMGILQSLSLISGISRSATTISAGLLSNFSRKKAVEMAFFVSIPVSFGGAFFDLYKSMNMIKSGDLWILFYIFVVSFILSLFFMKKILNFIINNSLYIFIYYRIVFGVLLMFI